MNNLRLIFCLILSPLFTDSQVDFSSGNIFQTDYFIENKGQYDFNKRIVAKKLFAAEMSFGDVYFHKNGFSIHQKKNKIRT